MSIHSTSHPHAAMARARVERRRNLHPDGTLALFAPMSAILAVAIPI
jgi:hypothetical protein